MSCWLDNLYNVFRRKSTACIAVAFAFILLSTGFSPAMASERSFEGLTTPPADSAEAERVRIWLPIERQSRCRVTIDILNDSNRVIRHLVDRLMSPSYYNYYWDKMDDSGSFVEPGKYVYIANDCGKKSYGEVTARFKKWEAASRLFPPQDRWSRKIGFELLEDSATVTIRIFDHRGKLVDEPVVDSLMNKGKYEFEWGPAPDIPRGFYTFQLIIGDFMYSAFIGYRR